MPGIFDKRIPKGPYRPGLSNILPSRTQGLFNQRPTPYDPQPPVQQPPVEQPPAPQPPAPIGRGDFNTGLRQGVNNVVSSLYGVLATGGAALGQDEFAERQLATSNEYSQRASEHIPRVHNIQDVESFGDLIDYVQGGLGSQVPVIASLAAGGPAGLAARGLARGAVSKTAAVAGGTIAAGTGLETGFIFPELANDPVAREDYSLQELAGIAATGGAVAGSLEALPVFHVFKRLGLGKNAVSGVKKNAREALKNAGITTLQSAVLEAGTEGLQTIIEKATHKYVNDNIEIFDEKGIDEIINASALGFFVGGSITGPTSIAKELLDTRAESKIDDQIGEDELNAEFEEYLVNHGDTLSASRKSAEDGGYVSLKDIGLSPSIELEENLEEKGIFTYVDLVKKVSRLNLTPGQKAVAGVVQIGLKPGQGDLNVDKIDFATQAALYPERVTNEAAEALHTIFESPDVVLKQIQDIHRQRQSEPLLQSQDIEDSQVFDNHLRKDTLHSRSSFFNSKNEPSLTRVGYGKVFGKEYDSTSAEKRILRNNEKDDGSVSTLVPVKQAIVQRLREQGITDPLEVKENLDAQALQLVQGKVDKLYESGSTEKAEALSNYFEQHGTEGVLTLFEVEKKQPLPRAFNKSTPISLKGIVTKPFYDRATKKFTPRKGEILVEDKKEDDETATKSLNVPKLVKASLRRLGIDEKTATDAELKNALSEGISLIQEQTGIEIPKNVFPKDLDVNTALDARKKSDSGGNDLLKGIPTVGKDLTKDVDKALTTIDKEATPRTKIIRKEPVLKKTARGNRAEVGDVVETEPVDTKAVDDSIRKAARSLQSARFDKRFTTLYEKNLKRVYDRRLVIAYNEHSGKPIRLGDLSGLAREDKLVEEAATSVQVFREAVRDLSQIAQSSLLQPEAKRRLIKERLAEADSRISSAQIGLLKARGERAKSELVRPISYDIPVGRIESLLTHLDTYKRVDANAINGARRNRYKDIIKALDSERKNLITALSTHADSPAYLFEMHYALSRVAAIRNYSFGDNSVSINISEDIKRNNKTIKKGLQGTGINNFSKQAQAIADDISAKAKVAEEHRKSAALAYEKSAEAESDGLGKEYEEEAKKQSLLAGKAETASREKIPHLQNKLLELVRVLEKSGGSNTEASERFIQYAKEETHVLISTLGNVDTDSRRMRKRSLQYVLNVYEGKNAPLPAMTAAEVESEVETLYQSDKRFNKRSKQSAKDKEASERISSELTHLSASSAELIDSLYEKKGVQEEITHLALKLAPIANATFETRAYNQFKTAEDISDDRNQIEGDIYSSDTRTIDSEFDEKRAADIKRADVNRSIVGFDELTESRLSDKEYVDIANPYILGYSRPSKASEGSPSTNDISYSLRGGARPDSELRQVIAQLVENLGDRNAQIRKSQTVDTDTDVTLVKDWSKAFGMESPIVITNYDNVGTGVTQKGLDGIWGSINAAYLPKADAIIMDPNLKDSQRLAVLAHEFGHAAFTKKLTKNQQFELFKSFRSWRDSKDPGKYVSGVRDVSNPEYAQDFEEWVADNVSRWITKGGISDKKPTNETQTIFKRLAELVLRLFNYLRGYIPSNETVNEFIQYTVAYNKRFVNTSSAVEEKAVGEVIPGDIADAKFSLKHDVKLEANEIREIRDKKFIKPIDAKGVDVNKIVPKGISGKKRVEVLHVPLARYEGIAGEGSVFAEDSAENTYYSRRAKVIIGNPRKASGTKEERKQYKLDLQYIEGHALLDTSLELSQKKQLRDAYQAIAEAKDPAFSEALINAIPSTRWTLGMQWGTYSSKDKIHYAEGFDEWIADNIAAWIDTSNTRGGKEANLVEYDSSEEYTNAQKIFRKLAENLRLYYNNVGTKNKSKDIRDYIDAAVFRDKLLYEQAVLDIKTGKTFGEVEIPEKKVSKKKVIKKKASKKKVSKKKASKKEASKEENFASIMQAEQPFSEGSVLAYARAFEYSESLTDEHRRVLFHAFNNKKVRTQLDSILKGHPELQKYVSEPLSKAGVLSPNAYVRLGIGYHLWLAGDLKITSNAESAFDRFFDYLGDTYGVLQESKQAEDIFSAIKADKIGTADFVLERYTRDTRVKRAVATIGKVLDRFTPYFDAVFGVIGARMYRTGNPFLVQLSDLIKERPGHSQNVGTSMLVARRIKTSEYFNRWAKAIKDLDEEQKREMLNSLQGGATDTLSKEAKEVLSIIKSIHKYAKNKGVDLGKLDGKRIPKVISIRYLEKNVDAFKSLLKKPKFKKILEGVAGDSKVYGYDYYINKVVDSVLNANGFIDKVGYSSSKNEDGIADFVPLISIIDAMDAAERKEFNKFFENDIDLIMPTFIQQTIKRVEYESRFGGEKLKILLSRAEKAGATPEQLKMARKYVKASMGSLSINQNGKYDRQIKNAIGVLMLVQNMAVLGLATMTSLVEPIGIAVRAGSGKPAFEAFKAGANDIASLVKGDKSKARQLSESLGVIEDSIVNSAIHGEYGFELMGKNVQWVNDQFFKWIGMSGWVKIVRTMSVAGGQEFIKAHAQGFNERSTEYLEELGLSAGDVVLDEDGNIKLYDPEELAALQTNKGKEERERDERVKNALTRFVEQSALRPDASTKPLWASDPYFSLVFHLKSFMYTFHDVIIRRALLEAGRNNFVPVMFLSTFVPAIFIVDIFRDLLKDALTSGEPRDLDRSFADHLMRSLRRSGVTGLGQLILDAQSDREYGGIGIESFLGPASGNILLQPGNVRLDDLLFNADRGTENVIKDNIPLQSTGLPGSIHDFFRAEGGRK